MSWNRSKMKRWVTLQNYKLSTVTINIESKYTIIHNYKELEINSAMHFIAL